MKNAPRAFVVFMAALAANLVLGVVLVLAGVPYPGAAITAVIVLVAVAYVVFVDSRGRWPGVPWYARLGRVLTFHRGQ